MIYAALAFLMVLCAALGGILYQKGREYFDLNTSILALARTVKEQEQDIFQLRIDVADTALKAANATESVNLASRVVALERSKSDANAPRQVRGINEARRMAQSMGGVEGIKVQ